jgi:hypothetical protein
MRRREFIAGLGAAITGSIQTDAQELLPSVPLWAIKALKAKGPARGRPLLDKRRAEARSAIASNALLGFARGGDVGKSRTLLFLLLLRHGEYPPGLDRLTKHPNLCSRTRSDRQFHVRDRAPSRNKFFRKMTYFSEA